MNKVKQRGISATQRTKPGSTRPLPYGLRELEPPPSPRVFCGTLTIADGNFLLQRTGRPCAFDVCFFYQVDRQLHDREVSILGYFTERTPPAKGADASIIAMKVVSHEAVSLRAYEIHQSGEGSCAVENWLRAERELLEH